MACFYVYIIQSMHLNIYYKGYTTDIERRLGEHNSNLGRYTKGKGPWKLVYLEKFGTKREALLREKQVKRYNAEYIRSLCGHVTNELNKK
jgi:putative endonuclease